MGSEPSQLVDRQLNERLATGGYRSTLQRQQVYNALLQKRDHPTADEVFMRTKQEMPEISMATVYNCLDALVKCGLVRQVNLDRSATRYCPNMTEHVHFFCEVCHGIFDIPARADAPKGSLRLPDGFRVSHYELSLRGLCPECAAKPASP